MVRRVTCLIALGVLLAVELLASTGAAAQAVQAGEPGPTRVGLVLSGGGAKGLTHIGVLRGLEEAGLRVDVVTGTSMGSLVGALYAVGYRPDEIDARLAAVDWQAVLTDRPDRTHLTVERRLAGERAVVSFPIRGGRVGLPTGVVRGVRGARVLHRLLWPALAMNDFNALPRPFAAVATDIETGEAVTLRRGSLVQAIRASLAIPGVLEPVRLNGRVLVDGGVARNLPAQDAQALGADLLICSDVSEPLDEAAELRTLFDILMQTVSFRMQASTAEERGRCDVLLEPDTEGLASFDFRPTAEWVRRGKDAVREASGELAALRRRIGPPPPRPTPLALPLPSRIGISRVEVRGVEGRTAELARSTVADLAGATVDAELLDRAVARLHAEGLFDQVVYHIEPSAGDTTVVFDLVENPGDRLDLGIRYDDHRQAALLFGASLHDLAGLGSWTRLDLRLGEELQAAARVLYGLGGASRFTVAADARYTRAILDRWAGGRQVAEVRSGIGTATLFGGTTLGRTTLAGIQVGLERSRAEASIAPADSSVVVGHWTVGARVIRDTFDRAAFPTRGISLLAASDWTRRFSGEPGFRQVLGRVVQLVPLGASTTLRLEVGAGVTEGSGVPVHRRFFLGGAYPSAVLRETQLRLVGVEPQSLEGLAFQRMGLAVQRQLASQFFLTVALEAGGAAPRWRIDAGDWTRGYGVALGALTPVGPLEVTVAGHDGGGWPGLSVVLGPRF